MIDTATQVADSEKQIAAALLLIRVHLRNNYRPGQRLPPAVGTHLGTARALARRLKLPEQAVSTALRTLDAEGEIEMVVGNSLGPRILGPGEMHSDDIALDATVRQRIRTGYYHFGQALPTGLLGDEFMLSSTKVARALRGVVWDDWVRQESQGPYGPGYYVHYVTFPAPDVPTLPLAAPVALLQAAGPPLS
ncbi:hypothetical protein ACFXJO_16665 [Streptomyces lavendulae]|uniref:hypothetical protein n=1 Tax=Streptomyces lavendulae TaxID=1914 RepID=UPI0036A5A515